MLFKQHLIISQLLQSSFSKHKMSPASILYNKKLRTKLPNSGRIISQGRKALILHETLWKVHQSQILAGAQEFPSLWQEEMHFAYLMAVRSPRLQHFEKSWLSLLKGSEGTGTIRAHPFWKGSQQKQPAVVEPENKLEGADKSSCGDGGGFSESFRICRAPGRELKTCCELLCAQQRQSGAVRNPQMGSVTLTFEQAKAKHSSLLIPKIHLLINSPPALSLRLKLAGCSV